MRMCVPRDGGLRARVVLGGAGEDFGRGGRGEQFGRQVWVRGGTVVRAAVRARVPRRRACASGGRAGRTTWGGRRRTSSGHGDEHAWERFIAARHFEDALSVKEAELAMARRLGAREGHTLCRAILRHVCKLGRRTGHSMAARRILWTLKLYGEEDKHPLISQQLRESLRTLERFEEAKSFGTNSVARRVLGESNETRSG